MSYSLVNGDGTLTLTVSLADHATCSIPHSGNSITFNVYSIGGQARMIASTSTLLDSLNEQIDSLSVVGSF